MKTRNLFLCAGIVLCVLLSFALAGAAPEGAAAEPEFTTDFDVERCEFGSSGRLNPYFSLNPGDQLTLTGEEDGEEVEVEITVSNNTKWINFVTPEGVALAVRARVVVEREWIDDELVEVSRNWYARCRQTNDVFYFGESVDIYEDGEVVSHDGSWQAGVGGAQPGIIIPARFLLGSRYYQEIAPGVALDRAEHVEMGLEVDAAGETFESCVRVVETTPLEPGHESVKVYCPDVGLVQDNVATLADYRRD